MNLIFYPDHLDELKNKAEINLFQYKITTRFVRRDYFLIGKLKPEINYRGNV